MFSHLYLMFFELKYEYSLLNVNTSVPDPGDSSTSDFTPAPALCLNRFTTVMGVPLLIPFSRSTTSISTPRSVTCRYHATLSPRFTST